MVELARFVLQNDAWSRVTGGWTGLELGCHAWRLLCSLLHATGNAGSRGHLVSSMLMRVYEHVFWTMQSLLAALRLAQAGGWTSAGTADLRRASWHP
jgi:hypothetical protein